jgi:hypothetical protein
VPLQSSTLCAAPFNVSDAEAADAPPSLPEDLLEAKFVYVKSPLYFPALSALHPYAVHKQAEKFVIIKVDMMLCQMITSAATQESPCVAW